MLNFLGNSAWLLFRNNINSCGKYKSHLITCIEFIIANSQIRLYSVRESNPCCRHESLGAPVPNYEEGGSVRHAWLTLRDSKSRFVIHLDSPHFPLLAVILLGEVRWSFSPARPPWVEWSQCQLALEEAGRLFLLA